MVLDLKKSAQTFRSDKQDASKKLVIFTGESFVAHQHLNDLLPVLKQHGIEPVIFLTPSSDAPKANIPSLQKFFFYEEGIFNDVIYPALDGIGGNKPGLTPTFNQMARAYNLKPMHIESVNDPRVQAALDDPQAIGTISIYQDMIFKKPFIDSVKERGLFFWNLHPALLPMHRGVLVALWSRMNGETRHGYTLHEIDAGIDTGRIISRHEGVLDDSKSVVENYFSFTRGGSALVEKALDEYMARGKVSYSAKMKDKSVYYSFPTEEDISDAWIQGVKMWGSPQEMHDAYIAYFGNKGLLSQKIKAAIADVEKTEAPRPLQKETRIMRHIPRDHQAAFSR